MEIFEKNFVGVQFARLENIETELREIGNTILGLVKPEFKDEFLLHWDEILGKLPEMLYTSTISSIAVLLDGAKINLNFLYSDGEEDKDDLSSLVGLPLESEKVDFVLTARDPDMIEHLELDSLGIEIEFEGEEEDDDSDETEE